MKIKRMDQETENWVNNIMVPIRLAEVGWTISDEGQPVALNVILLDATDRPDLADLGRVIRVEGVEPKTRSSIPVHYSLDPPTLIVIMKIESPVICEFAFRLPWKGSEDYFRLLVRNGAIYLSTGELIENALHEGFGIRIDGEELSKVINMWESSQT